MVKLIHHTEESAGGGVSPFDTAIREIVADEDVLIACPYITLEYLQPILRTSTSWRLLTDVEAWLGNYDTNERGAIREFIARHHEKIHDVRNLHAKAVIGETGALVGSANLTWTGVGSRDELAVCFDDSEQIEELRGWFDGLWTESTPAKLDEIDEHIRTSSPMPSSAKRRSATSIPSDSRRIRASLAVDREMKRRASGNFEEVDGSHGKLIEQVAKAPSREWIDRHFNLLNELLTTVGVSEDDSRIVTSIRKDGKMNTTINSRVVLGIQPARGRTMFILGANSNRIDELIAQAVEYWRFDGQNRESTPHLLKFVDGLRQVADPQFRRDWLSAALNEVNRGEHSPYRRHHKTVVYRAAVDHDYRTRVLNKAFGG